MIKSSCRDCQPQLRGYLDGELAAEESGPIEQHLAVCRACRDTLAHLAEVARLVGTLPVAIEPPPHFSANLQLRLARVRAGTRVPSIRQSRSGWRWPVAAATSAAAASLLLLVTPPRLGAQDLVGKVQASWQRLQSYSCRFVTEGVVRGRTRRFEQRQWFCKPDLFRVETDKHYPEQMYLERDRVTTFIPGARWHGRRVAITRPRRPREEGLPFPFGAEWPISPDITIDALVRELRSQEDGKLLGTETVLGKRCYELKFHTQRRGDRLPTHYLVWVDQETLLPLKVKIYHDAANQTISTAVDLQTNILVPYQMFHFQPAPDTVQVFGEVEPFVFALGLARARTPAFDTDPVGVAREEMRRRAPLLPFTPLAPATLPEGYSLVRVRASRGRWLDAYWIRNRTGDVIKLLEQPARAVLPLGVDTGVLVTAAGSPPLPIRWHEIRQPARIQYLAWDIGGTRVTLAAAGISRTEALQLAASLAPITPVRVAASPPGRPAAAAPEPRPRRKSS